MLKKRIKRTLIPDIIEQLTTWKDEGEITEAEYFHLKNELQQYDSNPSKQFILISPAENKTMMAAIETRCYWDY